MNHGTKQQSRLRVTAQVLQTVARAMLPFYRKIAGNQPFASKWTTAVVTADLDLMGRMLSTLPTLARQDDYGTNAIGYFIAFPFPLPVAYYTSGTTIPTGLVQFTFNTRAHRYVARSALPLYRKLAGSYTFARSFAAALRRKDTGAVEAMVRRLIPTSALRTVTVADYGVFMSFKTRFSKYPYRNQLFREMM
ncbi:hypothetical protein [Paenibacillus donghaensis]|uniref:Uncharacterized protein n=1 Tax=Paenibacillus donghaensis TaxID=414771 RepID=A0A2Z2KDJ0_9BACL|nr:hypothetical protein [Paenibacillus donghaensis]ASA21140.1 hypothetical protein B9T62_10285 [Paenibacillus donghaensis]